MYVRTLTGQLVTITAEVANLALMSDHRDYGTTDNIALQKQIGCRIMAFTGPEGLMTVLDELEAKLCKPQHNLLGKLWRSIANPNLRPG